MLLTVVPWWWCSFSGLVQISVTGLEMSATEPAAAAAKSGAEAVKSGAEPDDERGSEPKI